MKYLEMKKKAILSIVGKVKGFVRSVSGTPPIALEACADNMSIINYKIHGNSIQDGTPSPDNPVEVQSVGELVTDETDINYGKYKIPVTARSSNIINPQAWVSGVHSNGIIINKNNYITEIGKNYIEAKLPAWAGIASEKIDITQVSVIGFKINKNQTVNEYVTYYVGIDCYDKNDNKLGLRSLNTNIIADTEYRYTNFIPITNTKYIRLCILSREQALSDIRIYDFYITKENNLTYEPYHESITTNIYLDEPLRKVGDYADYIDFKNSVVVRNIAKLELKRGSFITYGSLPQNGDYSIYVWFSFNLSAVNQCFCTHLCYTNNQYGYEASNHITFTTNNNRIWIGIDSTIVEPSNNAKFKEWLTNNNPIIYYVPNTPTQTPISLPILPTFKGITTVYEIGTTIQPSNMEAEYYSTLKGE